MNLMSAEELISYYEDHPEEKKTLTPLYQAVLRTIQTTHQRMQPDAPTGQSNGATPNHDSVLATGDTPTSKDLNSGVSPPTPQEGDAICVEQ